MENKTLWIIIDLVLLIGVIYVCLFWLGITSNLKDPCGKCILSRPEIAPCFYKSNYPDLVNWSEIINKENINNEIKD